MPRTRPTETVEHRITLGGWERNEIEKWLLPRWGTVAAGFAWPVGFAALGAGLVLAGKYIGQGLYGILPDGEIGDTREDGTKMQWWEPIIGKSEYTFDTHDGEGNITGQETTKNWFYPVPILGSLSGSGINLGEGIGDWWKDKASKWTSDTIESN